MVHVHSAESHAKRRLRAASRGYLRQRCSKAWVSVDPALHRPAKVVIKSMEVHAQRNHWLTIRAVSALMAMARAIPSASRQLQT